MSTLEASPETVERDAHDTAVEAYIYLYPLVLMELTRRQGTNLPAGVKLGVAPMGEFAHVRQFPPGDFRAVVRPNFDTLYSSAWLDLREEPMIVSVPDTGGRYYLLPMLDMWTDVFAVPGKRTTGTQAARFAVTGPGWSGALPDGVIPIAAPTSYVWIIGRTQTNGTADYPAVHEVQDGMSIVPLSGRRGEPPRTDPSVDMDTGPLDQLNALSARDYFTLAMDVLELHPPHASDWSMLARMRRIGLRPGFDYDTVASAADDAPAAARALMRDALPRLAPVFNGWQMNVDAMGVSGNFYVKRAMVAMVGLGANPPEDAVYPLNLVDADGRPLDGAHDYVLHFDKAELPPVDAFWSVTMYDGEGFTVPNEIDRYAIGDRDELTYNSDGSLDLYLQHERPERASNWLPAPRGPLGVTLRLYAPRPQVLDRRWNPPAIRRRT